MLSLGVRQHTLAIPIALSITLTPTSCATVAALDSRTACNRVRSAGIPERVADPCGFADALAECAGLGLPDRQRIRERCEAEIAAVRGQLIHTPQSSATVDAGATH